MPRDFYLRLAAEGLRFPIGTDLVLAEQPDPQAVRRDGRRLGKVITLAAKRFRTPLAVPLMDLRLEKADLLGLLGVPETEVETFHFSEPPADDLQARLAALFDAPFAPRHQAQIDAVGYIRQETDLWPVGMAIGPFSLATKLVTEPITAIALAGLGVTAEEDPGIDSFQRCLALAEWAVARSIEAQIRAGARAIMTAEPAAGIAFLSPKQIASGADIFERFVIQPHLRLKRRLEAAGVDWIFHDCGELSPDMVRQFGERLHPAVLSLGSSVRLWEAAALVPDDVVLYGNLPTKNFYSDSVMPVEKVAQITRELLEKMRHCGHPHILGSECDVLHVPGAADSLWRKIEILLGSAR